MATYDTVLRDAKSLSCDDREMLAVELALFEEEQRSPNYEEAWAKEIQRRLDDFAAGRAILIDEQEADRLIWDDDVTDLDED